MRAGGDGAINLAAHGFAIQLALMVIETVEDRIDTVEIGICAHGTILILSLLDDERDILGCCKVDVQTDPPEAAMA
jgi:hypothetical protein